MNNIKRKEDKIKGVKRFAFIVGLFIVISSISVIAIYLNNYQKSIVGNVIGGEQALLIVQDLTDFSLNVNGSSASEIQNLTLTNDGDDVLNLLATIDTDKTLVDLNCLDWINDCDIGMYNLSNSEIVTNDILSIPVGNSSTFQLKANCLENSCLQNMSISILLES